MFDFGLDFVEFYRFEFSQEYGYLRLSDKARRTVRSSTLEFIFPIFIIFSGMLKSSMWYSTRQETSVLVQNLEEFYSMSGSDMNGSS